MTRVIRRTASSVLCLATLFGAAAWGTATHAAGGPAGGHSFNTGPQIRNGAHLEQELTVGDFEFWRITLKHGQRLMVQASVEVPGGYDPGASPPLRTDRCADLRHRATAGSLRRIGRYGNDLRRACDREKWGPVQRGRRQLPGRARTVLWRASAGLPGRGKVNDANSR